MGVFTNGFAVLGALAALGFCLYVTYTFLPVWFDSLFSFALFTPIILFLTALFVNFGIHLGMVIGMVLYIIFMILAGIISIIKSIFKAIFR